MKPKIGIMLLTFALGSSCWGQDAQKQSLPVSCTKLVRVHGAFPKGPFKWQPKETYKRSPVIKYQIQEDGTVSDAIITRSSGVVDIDKKVLAAVARWRYKPRPAGCGPIETEMSLTIDWANPQPDGE